MKVLKSIGNVKNRLTKIGKNEPLNFLSILIIIALDIFVLVNIFSGLDLQTKQITKPREVVPYQCQKLVNSNEDVYQNKTKSERDWDKIEGVLDNNNGYYQSNTYKMSGDFINNTQNEKITADCRAVYDQAQSLKENSELQSEKNRIETLERQIRTLEQANNTNQRQYDTMLLEKIAQQQDSRSLTQSSAERVKSDIERNEAKITDYEDQIKKLKNQVLSEYMVVSFLQNLETKAALISEELKTLEFWYPIKRLLFQLAFLLPLLVIFSFCYKYCVKKDKALLTLIFSHLLVIVCIPIIIEFFRLCFDLLPFHFFKDLIALLDALGLVALWNYILILIGILIALGLIYFVQKKLFARKRQMLKRIKKSQCCYCGVKLNADTKYCYDCGKANLKNCQHCGDLTFVEGEFCRVCGKSDF